LARRHKEHHQVGRAGWLRAAVLGANDGILSTASLVLGVATATHSHSAVLIAGLSGMVAGALSMAAGEYVSVSSQADTERADLTLEKKELIRDADGELRELTRIYIRRGLEPKLAAQVAQRLSEKDALEAHARDELGISEALRARPLQAALASAASFVAGAIPPVLAAYLAPFDWVVLTVFGACLALLAFLGSLGAWAGGAGLLRPTLRVLFWGAFAMAATAGIGALLHTQV
jgi:vacuolar iron transporter family protein